MSQVLSMKSGKFYKLIKNILKLQQIKIYKYD